MGQQTAEQIAQRAFDLGLLDERQLQDVWASFGSRNVLLQDFLQTLVRREFMTNYQVERLVKGERSGFFFGDYKVLYLVGSGTFARVYRAVHRETGKVVALKVLRNRYSENPVQASQFVREGRVGCTLRHPNIVPIYDVVSQGKMPLPGDGVHRGAESPRVRQNPQETRPGRGHPADDRHYRRVALRLRAGPDPPRPEDEQRPGLQPRGGEDRRLRPGLDG